ncbi:uncharacterized protein LOC128234798 isoform X2 [Mya arenaria]|uniref:uncharacterized protein LOC128234798 isoform X2 n=1 Tax=Mya arenaria TaxID=6604 RepID=UPI0022E52A0A|nr:uncharacterized protein LOC128234798 isoform X2 [Mya arenaria]
MRNYRRMDVLFVELLLGISLYVVDAQILTTKCPSNEWTKYEERCYLAVEFSHSWSKANQYCQKYGARLVEPAGYSVSDQVHSLVTSDIPSSSAFWTGFNRISHSNEGAHVGYWSNGEQTTVEVGVWGHNEPDVAAGDCASISVATGLWHMSSCDDILPFVCELDPCPGGVRDTFMCNGRCLGSNARCNGVNDCGNNEDEQDCASSCTHTVTGSSGEITVGPGNNYQANANCLWAITSPPGTRINVYFEYFTTEKDTDYLEFWDGGPSLSTSHLSARVSGSPSLDSLSYTSSYNFLVLKFVADEFVNKNGFKLTWTTAFTCSYNMMADYFFSNTDIQYDTYKLGSRQTVEEKCEDECDSNEECVGFGYNSDPDVRTCYFMNLQPILVERLGHDVYMKTCPPGSAVQSSIPLLSTDLQATKLPRPLTTPLYPAMYIGNFEREYTITTQGNNLITLEVLHLDLCCSDIISIFDKDHTLLSTLGSDSAPGVILSTGNVVYIRMDLEAHRQCGGALIQYTQGCDTTMSGSGEFASPGYGTMKSYPHLTTCRWRIEAPSADRSVTVIFNEFNMHSSDNITVTYSDMHQFKNTSTGLKGMSLTSDSYMLVDMATSALDNAPGFKASFSPGCPSLESEEYTLDTTNSNYGATVLVSCASGFLFSGRYSGQSSVTLTCELGGQWSDPDLPICTQGYCGFPQFLENGYLVSSSGVLGGDTVTYACNHGYNMIGSATVTCQSNNLWETLPTCNAIACLALDLILGGVYNVRMRNKDGTQQGSVVQLVCDVHEEIIGPSLVQCDNGTWDYLQTQQPSCRAIKCETPVVVNGYLSPPRYGFQYVEGEDIEVICKEGYQLNSNATFSCGVDTVLPLCQKKQCSLASYPNVVPSDGSSQTMYHYGDTVSVTCSYDYVLANVDLTDMNISCLYTGQWDIQPTCKIEFLIVRMDCIQPYIVKGSVYSPQFPCTAYNCSFTFSCSDRYVLEGYSSSNDRVVRCGAVNDGLWDFGELRCLGGQCRDPGYPASGHLVGNSFLEGSDVTFECDDVGYAPFEKRDGVNYTSQGMTCVYDPTHGMTWRGIMPECKDNQEPVIYNCQNDQRIRTLMLKPSNYLSSQIEPFPGDNTGIKVWHLSVDNFRLNQPLDVATSVLYKAEDFEGNVARCWITVTIPESIECSNDDIATLDPITSATIFTGNDQSYFTQKRGDVNVTFVPEFVSIPANSSALRTAYEIQVTSRDQDGLIVDTCTLQFRPRAPTCAVWQLHIPNGNKSCINTFNGVQCSIFCNSGFVFMENDQTSVIIVTCNETTGWNRDPPVCASYTESYLIYAAGYTFKYNMEQSVTDAAACVGEYSQEVETKLEQLATAMEVKCNNAQVAKNHVTLTLLEHHLSFSMATSRLQVYFRYKIEVQDESLPNVRSIKETCARHIQTSFNTFSEYSVLPIANLSSVTGDGFSCGAGEYDFLSGDPVYDYDCLGYRRPGHVASLPVCLVCPLGYYYVAVSGPAAITHNCDPCPAGTYGIMSTDGAECVRCPGGANPGLIGQTDYMSCNLKGQCSPGEFSKDGLTPCTLCPKGFYSAGILGQTCTRCETHKVTLQEGSKSHVDCLSLEEVDALNDDVLKRESPCHPNPCLNGGTCIYARNDYRCNCPSGYTGDLCRDVFDGCTGRPCKNGQTCIPGTTTSLDPLEFQCSCSTEFDGLLCENDRFGCASNYCLNNGTCHNSRHNHRCMCPSNSGYQGATCSKARDPCTDMPCKNGTCIPHGIYYRTCDCWDGYTGLDCETNINDCLPNFCQNGGTCVDKINGFSCQCLPGYHGNNCQYRKACDTQCVNRGDRRCHTCVQNNTATCTDVADSFVCTCMSGYEGTSCEIEISGCNSYPCEHDGTCVANLAGTSYICVCPEPWTGIHCENQINNCPAGNECFNGGQCFSTTSGYVCNCPSNYIGMNCNENYELCDRTSPCVGNHSTCMLTNTGELQCQCQTGTRGDNCHIQVDSCTSTTCLNGGTCSMGATQVMCACMPGYTGQYCDADVNECLTSPCEGSNQECVDGFNSRTCVCSTGYRGEDCSKIVEGFDYIIQPRAMCRTEASSASFGDGVTAINALTVAFWVRFTVANENAAILNIIGANYGDLEIPSTPVYQLKFMTSGLYTYVMDSQSGRKKRDEEVLPYDATVMDGYWHHLAVTWDQTREELTMYQDGTYVEQRFITISDKGFLVFGDFDTVSGTSLPESSFEGKISHLFVVGDALNQLEITNLYNRQPSYSPSSRVLLNQERSLMQEWPVDYNSELTLNSERCLKNTPGFCPGLVTDENIPVATVCPSDSLAVTARTETPTWPVPTFEGTGISPPFSTIQAGSPIDWGIHGITYAVFDTSSNAAVCSFRLYNRGSNCAATTTHSVASCVEDTPNITRCSSPCSTGTQMLAGPNPLFISCSMYGMWDEAFKYSQYIFPECAATEPLTHRVTLLLMATSSVNCNDIIQAYKNAVNSAFTTLNGNVGGQLCAGGSCVNVLSNACTCNGASNVEIDIDFGLLRSELVYNNRGLTPEELLRMAVGDLQLFHYVDPTNNATYVSPDFTTFVVRSTEECPSGMMISAGMCVRCGAGTEYNSATKMCERCPIGEYKASSTGQCSACQASLTTDGTGASDISYCRDKCQTGSFFSLLSGDQSCVGCPVGFFQDDVGQFSCKACPQSLTTENLGSVSQNDCQDPGTFTTTTTPGEEPSIGASTEGGLNTGVIIAIVIAIILFLTIVLLIVVCCCCKDYLPCLNGKKQIVSPAIKDGYHAKRYGQPDMHFTNYNLRDVREKKGRHMDRLPFIEPAMSEETGSVKTDISVHVPVFFEKMDGSVKKKSLYMQNGSGNLNLSLPPSARHHDPMMTSSPRSHYVHEQEMAIKPKKKRRRRKEERSSSRHHGDEEGFPEPEAHPGRAHMPKALAPMPLRLKSTPPADVILRPSSALEQRRSQVKPEHYEEFLAHDSSQRRSRSPERSHNTYDEEGSRLRNELEIRSSRKSQRSQEGHRSHEGHRSKSYDDEENELSNEMRRSRSHAYDENERSRSRSKKKRSKKHREREEEREVEEPGFGYSTEYYENIQPFNVRRIEVESDEDLR